MKHTSNIISKNKNKRIKKYIEKWKKIFLLDGYRISYKIGKKEDIKEYEKQFGKVDSYAFAHMGYPLRQIHIIFNPEHINNDLEKTVMHELLHCMTEPLRQSILSIMEEYVHNTKMYNVMLDMINCRVDELIEHLTGSFKYKN